MMGAPLRWELLPRVALEKEARAEMGPGYNAQCLLAATYFFWLCLVAHGSYNLPSVIGEDGLLKHLRHFTFKP